MESIKAISLMVLWTVLSLYALYYLGAFENFRNPFLIVPISLSDRYTYDQYVYLLQSWWK